MLPQTRSGHTVYEVKSPGTQVLQSRADPDLLQDRLARTSSHGTYVNIIRKSEGIY